MKRTNKESPSELFSKTGGTPLWVQKPRPPETKSSERITFFSQIVFPKSKTSISKPIHDIGDDYCVFCQ